MKSRWVFINELRERIDALDIELLALFEERMDVSAQIAAYKKERGLPILNKEREAQVIANAEARLKNKSLTPLADEFITSLMNLSKRHQSDILSETQNAIGYYGVEGSFCEQALINYFGGGRRTKNFETFEELFRGLQYKEADYGVVPIENSSTGSIAQIYDLLRAHDLFIVGETQVAVEQNLIGVSGARLSDIKEIYSHAQGFEQSAEFLKTMRGCALMPYYSTASSVKFIAESNDKTKAAIGSARAAQLYGLEVLAANITTAKRNYTRFIIISREWERAAPRDKMTLMFSLPNKSGSLVDVLNIFSLYKINMSKIESRPIGDGSFSYYFYIDIEGEMADDDLNAAFEGIKLKTQEFKVLGAYKKGEVQNDLL